MCASVTDARHRHRRLHSWLRTDCSMLRTRSLPLLSQACLYSSLCRAPHPRKLSSRRGRYDRSAQAACFRRLTCPADRCSARPSAGARGCARGTTSRRCPPFAAVAGTGRRVQTSCRQKKQPHRTVRSWSVAVGPVDKLKWRSIGAHWYGGAGGRVQLGDVQDTGCDGCGPGTHAVQRRAQRREVLGKPPEKLASRNGTPRFERPRP